MPMTRLARETRQGKARPRRRGGIDVDPAVEDLAAA